MRLIRPVGAVLALALAAVPAMGADLTRRDFDRVIPVKLETILASPHSMMEAEVKFHATFAGVTDLFDLQRTRFRPELHTAIAIWDGRARLWQADVRHAVLTSVYIPKDKIPATRSTFLTKYEELELVGVVRGVIDGVPQIEITGIRPLPGEGAYTDAAIYHVEQGVALANDGARDLADEHFAKALLVDLPVHAKIDVAKLRGRNLIESGHFELAVQVLGVALGLARTDVGLKPVERADLYALLAKAESEQTERSDGALRQSAVDHASKALEFDPANGEAYAVLGIGLAGLGRYDEARRNCDNAVRLRPADAEVRWYLGRIFDQQGRSDEAIEALKKAIDLTPKDWRIHKAIATAYFHRGQKGGASASTDTATALREFDITLRLNPNDADVLTQSGLVLETAAKQGIEVQIGSSRQPATRELALARYRAATQADAKSVAAWKALGLLEAALGHAEAVKAAVEALKGLKATADADEVSKAPVAPPADAAPAVPAPAAAPLSEQLPVAAPAAP